MDPLTALRACIINGRDSSIVEDGSNLIIDGVIYDGYTSTAFKAGKDKTYPLFSIYYQWIMKDKIPSEYIKKCTSMKLRFVLINDKKIVLSYLKGESDALDRIDQSIIAAGADPQTSSLSSVVGLSSPTSSAQQSIEKVRFCVNFMFIFELTITES
jgi:Paf1 complex subunit CDC73 N-terminal